MGVLQSGRPPVRALVWGPDSFECRYGVAWVSREPGCVTSGERRGAQAVQEHREGDGEKDRVHQD